MNNETIINPSFSTFNWLDDDVFENQIMMMMMMMMMMVTTAWLVKTVLSY